MISSVYRRTKYFFESYPIKAMCNAAVKVRVIDMLRFDARYVEAHTWSEHSLESETVLRSRRAYATSGREESLEHFFFLSCKGLSSMDGSKVNK